MIAGTRLNDDELLWRRIHRDHVKSDGRVSSAAFSGSEMSVDVERIQSDMSITLEDGAGVAEVETVVARGLSQDVVADPLPENPAHALVIGDKPRRVKRALRDAARFISRVEILSAR